MDTKTEVYVDTSALIAFSDRSDSHHALFRRLFSDPPSLVTTPLVVAEGHAWFLRRYDRGKALQFMAFIEELEPLRVLAIGSDESLAAAAILRRFSDQDLTVADAIGLHLMGERGLKQCWSTDRHMRLTGAQLPMDAL